MTSGIIFLASSFFYFTVTGETIENLENMFKYNDLFVRNWK